MSHVEEPRGERGRRGLPGQRGRPLQHCGQAGGRGRQVGTILQEMDNPALSPSDLQTVRPLHLTLVSLATCLLPSVVLPLCQHYWAFLLSFGAVGFLTGQDLS